VVSAEKEGMPRALVTGANRGLGLEFARQYAAAGWQVIAGCRRPQEAHELAALGEAVEIRELDVADDRSIAAFLRALAGVPIDVAIMNAGIGAGGPRSAGAVTRAAWEPAVVVNTLAPLRLATGLKSSLQQGAHKKVVGISSLAASMTSYRVEGHYIYRASKAALNQLWRSLAIEWRPLGITCLLLRPGKVRTRMTDFSGDLSPEQSVRGMCRVIAAATLADSGRFLGYDGGEVPW
jgi:NAD(P)-dependent dehydrogenase (short-subunit alcohol dehydrogenase family)